jgi:hypothetical protein
VVSACIPGSMVSLGLCWQQLGCSRLAGRQQHPSCTDAAFGPSARQGCALCAYAAASASTATAQISRRAARAADHTHCSSRPPAPLPDNLVPGCAAALPSPPLPFAFCCSVCPTAVIRVRPAFAGEGRYFVRVPEGTNKGRFAYDGGSLKETISPGEGSAASKLLSVGQLQAGGQQAFGQLATALLLSNPRGQHTSTCGSCTWEVPAVGFL